MGEIDVLGCHRDVGWSRVALFMEKVMVVDIKYEIEKHGSAEEALMFALIRLHGYSLTQEYLMDALREAGVDADKLLAEMPKHP